MEEAIDTIIETFHKYSTMEGDPDTLSKKEFNKLVNESIPSSFKVRLD